MYLFISLGQAMCVFVAGGFLGLAISGADTAPPPLIAAIFVIVNLHAAIAPSVRRDASFTRGEHDWFFRRKEAKDED